MSHELELVGGQASLSAAGSINDLWHGLGFGNAGGLMTVKEALKLARMNRHLRVEKVPAPYSLTAEGEVRQSRFVIPDLYYLVLEGGTFGDVEIEDKVVGVCGKGAADAHATLSIQDRGEIAEFAVNASNGAAVVSTAALIKDATQMFICLKLDDTVIDPHGIADVIANYATVVAGFDSSLSTELGGSNVRVVCKNTMAWHMEEAQRILKVRHTSSTAKGRMEQGAKLWAIAQDRAGAMAILAQKLLEVRGNKMDLVRHVVDGVIGKKPEEKGRKQTIWLNKMETIEVLAHAPTNNVGDNAWAALNVITEFVDWQSPIKCNGVDETQCRFEAQFDGTNDAIKAKTAERLLALAN